MFQPAGNEFRKDTFCYLGSWHVYKMATTCVWRMAAADFIAPLFHQFFPNSTFPLTPRLVLSSRIFSLIRLAYPFFRVSLTEALAKEALSDKQRNHLTNLQLLCEWFIPKVRIVLLVLFLFFHTGRSLLQRLASPITCQLADRFMFILDFSSKSPFFGPKCPSWNIIDQLAIYSKCVNVFSGHAFGPKKGLFW